MSKSKNPSDIPQFSARATKNVWRIINSVASIWRENSLGNLFLDIIFSTLKFTVFLELLFRKTVRLSGQIMSADK